MRRSKPPIESDAQELIEREKRQRRRLAALLDVSRLVASTLDPHDIFEIVADKMSDLIGATEVTIFVLEEETGVLRPLVARTDILQKGSDISMHPFFHQLLISALGTRLCTGGQEHFQLCVREHH